MRTITAAEQTLLEDRDRLTYAKVVAGQTDLADWLAAMSWHESVDGGSGQGTVKLLAKTGGTHVAPVIADTVILGQRLCMSVAHRTTPGIPAAGDWIEVHDGTVTEIDWTDTIITVKTRARLMTTLASRWIESDRKYGTDAGRDMHLVMRDVLSDWGAGVALAVGVAFFVANVKAV